MSEFSPEEADFLAFVRRYTNEFDEEWAEIADGNLDVTEIIAPLYQKFETDAEKASAMIVAYSSDFVSYVRSRNGDLGKRMEVISGWARRHGLEIDEAFFAGRFPTHSFNAQACREGETHLLLLHTGFERLMIEAARLLFATHDKIGSRKVERWPEPSWWARASLDDLLANFADLIASFIAEAEPYPFYLNRDLYPFEPDNELPAFTAGSAGQDFALAHELGHLALGHLRQVHSPSTRYLRSGLNVLPKSIREEHEADIFAARVLFCTEQEQPEQGVLDLIYGKYIGVGLFFDLDALIAEIEQRAFGLPVVDEYQTHPPARRREAVMLSAIRKEIKNSFLFADRRLMGRTFKRVREPLIKLTLRRLVEVKS